LHSVFGERTFVIKKAMISVSIVEDDHDLRKSVENIIGQAMGCLLIKGYSNAEAFLNDLNVNTPEVVIMDIELPGMNGYHVLKLQNRNFPKYSL